MLGTNTCAGEAAGWRHESITCVMGDPHTHPQVRILYPAVMLMIRFYNAVAPYTSMGLTYRMIHIYYDIVRDWGFTRWKHTVLARLAEKGGTRLTSWYK